MDVDEGFIGTDTDGSASAQMHACVHTDPWEKEREWEPKRENEKNKQKEGEGECIKNIWKIKMDEGEWEGVEEGEWEGEGVRGRGSERENEKKNMINRLVSPNFKICWSI
jgi:hypothetical protein